jgi:hypothetical protein
MTWDMARERIGDGRKGVEEAVRKAVGVVQENTGLKLREAMGWGKEEAGKVEQAVEKKVEEGKDKVAQVVEGAKKLV